MMMQSNRTRRISLYILHNNYVIGGFTCTRKSIWEVPKCLSIQYQRRMQSTWTMSIAFIQQRTEDLHVHHHKSDIAVINAHKVDYYW